jgi:hypothetical protein
MIFELQMPIAAALAIQHATTSACVAAAAPEGGSKR